MIRIAPLFLLVPTLAQAVVLTQSGYLLGATDAPVNEPAQAMTFALFDAPSGGSELWSATCTVAVTQGYYALALGDGGCGGAFPTDAFDVERWLRTTIGSIDLSPRVRIAPVAMAHAALDARRLEGQTLADLDARYTGATDTISWTRLGDVPLDLADGDDVGVTDVTAGSGLAGTGTPADPLYVASDGITADMLASDPASLAKLTSGALALDAAGNVLTGGLRLAPQSTCDAARSGLLRWQGGSVDVCDGAGGWVSIGGPANPAGSGTGTYGSSGNPGQSCRAIKLAVPTATSGDFHVDPDGLAGPLPAFQTYCDMSGGYTLVANIYDTGADDVPNTLSTVAGGWQQNGVGGFTSTVTRVQQATGANVSGAVSPETVRALFKAGATSLRLCIVATSGAESCRTNDEAGAFATLEAAPETVTNSTLAAYRPSVCSDGAACQAAYTYGRFVGIPASRNDYAWASFVAGRFCVHRSLGATHEFGADATGLCENNDSGGYMGVWHGWGSGISFKPWATDSSELSNGAGADPSAVSYGLRVYVGGHVPRVSGTQASPAASCQAIKDATTGLPSGNYWIDPDGAGPISPFQAACDLVTGDTLVANLYDTTGDDLPNTVGAIAAGWRQDGSGAFVAPTSIVRAIGSGVSGGVSPSVVRALFTAGATRMRVCLVSTGDTETCLSSNTTTQRFQIAGVPAGLGNSNLAQFAPASCSDARACDAAYTYGRLSGQPGSREDFTWSLFASGNYCVSRSLGATHEFGDDGTGLCENNDSGGYMGVWHGWGGGISLKPWATDQSELSNGTGADPSAASYGLRVWVGGRTTVTLGTQANPATSCRAIALADPNLPNSHYWVDLDGTGPRAPIFGWCDLVNGGWTLLSNLSDSIQDDLPNAVATIGSTWAQTGNGAWTTNQGFLVRGVGMGTSSGLAPTFVRDAFAAGTFTDLRVCLVSTGDGETCRSSNEPGLSLTVETAPAGVVNTLLSPFTVANCMTSQGACNAAYTFGRLSGLPGSRNDFTWASFQQGGYCVHRTPGAGGEFGDDGTGLCENNDSSGYMGVWHGWGGGISLKPWLTDASELSNATSASPSVNSVGVRVYAR